jgi:hypothetical protein
MNKIYQVKISLKPANYNAKSQTITGIVIAKDQAAAVAVAMKKAQNVLSEKKMPFTPKLVSAIALPSDFIYYEESKEVKNDDTLNSEDHA